MVDGTMVRDLDVDRRRIARASGGLNTSALPSGAKRVVGWRNGTWGAA